MRRRLSAFLPSIAALAVSGCANNEMNAGPPASAPQQEPPSTSVHGRGSPKLFARLSVAEAEALVASWIKANVKGEVFWQKQPPMKDVTPKEVGERLHAQIFRLADYPGSVDEADAYLIQDGRVLPLSIGFGGQGLESLVVCDLDGNGQPELAYTYSWGSGLHRTHLELVCFPDGKPTRLAASFVVQNVPLVLSKGDDRSVAVRIPRGAGEADVHLGGLSLTSGEKGPKFDVELEPGLAKKWRDLIWKSPLTW